MTDNRDLNLADGGQSIQRIDTREARPLRSEVYAFLARVPEP